MVFAFGILTIWTQRHRRRPLLLQVLAPDPSQSTELSTGVTVNEKPSKMPKEKDRKSKRPKLLTLTMASTDMQPGAVGANMSLLLTQDFWEGVDVDTTLRDSIESENKANATCDGVGHRRTKQYARVAEYAQDPG